MCCLRIFLIRKYIQYYLLQVIKLTSRILNSFNGEEAALRIQQTVIYVDKYVLKISLQLLLPCILEILFVLLWKNKSILNIGILDAVTSLIFSQPETPFFIEGLFISSVYSLISFWLLFTWSFFSIFGYVHQRKQDALAQSIADKEKSRKEEAFQKGERLRLENEEKKKLKKK